MNEKSFWEREDVVKPRTIPKSSLNSLFGRMSKKQYKEFMDKKELEMKLNFMRNDIAMNSKRLDIMQDLLTTIGVAINNDRFERANLKEKLK